MLLCHKHIEYLLLLCLHLQKQLQSSLTMGHPGILIWETAIDPFEMLQIRQFSWLAVPSSIDQA